MKNPQRILIVDDNDDNLDMMRIILENNSYAVDSAFNGKEALELLRETKYDLIISDILMPGMDGFQFCRECKKDEQLKSIVFVFYTATYVDAKDEEFALSLGAQKFIRKPQEPNVFLKLVKDIFEEYKNKRIDNSNVIEKDEKEILKLYSERLVAKLEKRNLELEKEVESHKKTFKELIKAKERAEEANKLKTAFLSNMSHEVRTPMNGIIGFTNLLKSQKLSQSEGEKFINIIQASGKRLVNLIEDIINISKIETHQMQVYKSEFNLNEDLFNIYNMHKPAALDKGIEIIFESCLQENQMIYTDREKLNSIVSNLIKNAVKYTEEGKIDIKCTKSDDDFRFVITDTGIGIPPDRLDAIFDYFVQADVADKMARQGAGLGLTIAKEYIQMLGGKITLDSKENEGTTVSFSIPFGANKNADLESNSNSIHKTLEKKLKILIAEDDEVSRIYLKLILEKYASEILVAHNGKEAVNYCKDNSDIDMVLMDIKMPEYTGYQAIEKIREFNSKVFIIAQTAYGLGGDKQKLLNIGCNEYLSKPIDEDDLDRVLQKRFSMYQ